MTNSEFVDLLVDPASAWEPWVKIRWIHIGGMSWGVMKALSIKYGERLESPLLKQLHAAVAADEQRRIQDATLQALKNDERVNVNVVPMFNFLFREDEGRHVRQFDTVLRTSADASDSLLVQSIIVLVADKALEVVTAYQAKIKKFERKILVRPTIDTVRNLQILSANLILHRRTLGPIKTVVAGSKVAGFMSHRSLIYLADVHDQMEYVLSQLDVIAGIGENLVDYTFNVCPPPNIHRTSYQMNEVIRRLMLVTVIFLPLTLLTGYFGMNFDFMWTTKHNHSDVIYWAIALPIMAIIPPPPFSARHRAWYIMCRKRCLRKRWLKPLIHNL
ncbi:Magnesium-like protein [Mycena sanguinolenta]|uniref:Magnesium-like protein n=1 Tax=Mycena sanguinolenta TaxID=230812 RepID=A0A8H6XR66_9AGAR|nr:Magnesium-like protein [Mycena sanguinolenta]